jgi:hypothetical protein
MKKNMGLVVLLTLMIPGCLSSLEEISNSKCSMSLEDVEDWMANYYTKPQPDRVPAALEAMEQHRVLATHRTAEASVAGFLALVFRDNAQYAVSWAERSDSYSKELRRTVWLGLWLSNTEPARDHLSCLAQNATRGDLDYLRILLTNQPFDLRQLKPVDPNHLDMLWGAFFASGEPQYLKRIIWAMSFLDQRTDPFKYATAAAAKWSLKSHALDDANILETCRDELREASGPIRNHLLDIVSQVEGKAMLIDEREEAIRVFREEFPQEVFEQYRQR